MQASRLHGTTRRRIAPDWEERFAYRPAPLETLIEIERFAGSSYKAANWICVGKMKGRGKLDVKREYKKPVKSIWLRPLTKAFRTVLCR
ncbi:MAG: DUF4338 domain-containing protein [Candidatus Eisenbacteria bacterium]|nr:DUF4338 domain-containing protein [Candidatus Eisenbacteria bacterium]